MIYARERKTGRSIIKKKAQIQAYSVSVQHPTPLSIPQTKSLSLLSKFVSCSSIRPNIMLLPFPSLFHANGNRSKLSTSTSNAQNLPRSFKLSTSHILMAKKERGGFTNHSCPCAIVGSKIWLNLRFALKYFICCRDSLCKVMQL